MAESAIFDTHRFVKDLVTAGMSEPVAETLAEKQVELLSGELATRVELAQVEKSLKSDLARVEAELKSDLARVEAELKSNLAGVKANLKSEVAALKSELLKWVLSAIGIATAVIGVLIGLFA